MADFNYFLNRQGIRGLQGVKGDQGDSPIITVQTETPNEYILKITNPDGTELISPNLRGNKININEGTYVRYNTDTGELYTSTADGATGELAGVVRLATDADITNMDERAVVTPSQLADALSQYLVSPDSSVKIVQNVENSLTELTVEGGLKELPIASADTLGGVKIGENLSITEDGTLTVNDGNYIKTSQVSKDGFDSGIYLNSFNGNRLTTIQPKFNTLNGALEIDSISYLKAATYSASEPADEDMTNNWTDKNGYFTGFVSTTGFISGNVRFIAGSGSSQVVFKLMEAGFISGIDQRGRHKFSKIETSMDGTTYTEYNNSNTETKYIRFTFNYTFLDETLASFSTRIRTLASNIAGGEIVPLSVKVDNQTIQIVDDKLHANFDEINGEISNVSAKVTTLEGQVGGVSTTVDNNTTDIEGLNKTKNDNIFDIGKFTVVGSPNITEDGIINSPSVETNYAKANFNISTLQNKSWHIRQQAHINFEKPWDFAIPYGNYTSFIYGDSWNALVFNGYTTDNGTEINKTQVFIAIDQIRDKILTVTPNVTEADLIIDFYYNLEKQEYYFTATYEGVTWKSKVFTGTAEAYNSQLSVLYNTIGYLRLGEHSDLKQFSITVDGKEVFNGLMSSTKPIYDKITTLNTNVSDFELETSNNFSAVNSALNEKANLSDLSKCASLADFNRLSATVTTLESQVGDVSAVLDNINGEVI